MLPPKIELLITNNYTQPLQLSIPESKRKLSIKATGPYSYRFPNPNGVSASIPVSQSELWKHQELDLNGETQLEFTSVSDTTLKLSLV